MAIYENYQYFLTKKKKEISISRPYSVIIYPNSETKRNGQTVRHAMIRADRETHENSTCTGTPTNTVCKGGRGRGRGGIKMVLSEPSQIQNLALPDTESK